MERAAYDHIYRIEQVLWWYRVRRIVCEAVLSKWLPSRSLQLLDVGCGTGYNMGWLSHFGTVHGLDMSPEALEYCRLRGQGEVVQGLADQLPTGAETFDVVSAFDVIEHLDDDLAALREFHRVLRPQGHLILTVPALPFMFNEHDRLAHHQRRYWKSQLLQRVRASGFSIVHCSYFYMLLLPLMVMCNLMLRLWPNRPMVEYWMPVKPVNELMTAITLLERPFVLRWGLPLGSTVVLLARKTSEAG